MKGKNQGKLNKNIDKYELMQNIGQGQYGNVYKAKLQNTNQFYAVKVMPVQKFKNMPKLTELTNNQMDILSKMNHPNIIRFVEMLQTSTNFYLIYQFCNGGTLAQLIKQKKYLPENEAINIFRQLIAGFNVLFQKKILHRDLKPTNILFKDGVIKIADFGFCKELTKEKDMTQTMVGSPIYMAPQVLKGQPYDHRADIWSLGVVLYEMLFGVCPYEQSSIPKLISVINNNLLSFPKVPKISDSLRVFIKRILQIKVKDRMSPKQFIKYPLGVIVSQNQAPEIKMDYKGAVKFTRLNLLYISQTLQMLAQKVIQLPYLKVSFMTYKIINNIWKNSNKESTYWDELKMQNIQYKWNQFAHQEAQLLKPYGQVVRQALKKCDNSLKVKLELEKDAVDSKFYIQCIREVSDQKIKNRLIDCMLINIHYLKVMDKRKPDWRDYTHLKLTYAQKQQIGAKFARYF